MKEDEICWNCKYLQKDNDFNDDNCEFTCNRCRLKHRKWNPNHRGWGNNRGWVKKFLKNCPLVLVLCEEIYEEAINEEYDTGDTPYKCD